MRLAGSDGAFVEVELLGRTHPGATDFWDANWLNAKVRASSHGLKAAMDVCLRVDELQSLSSRLLDLHRTVAGQLEFWPMEPNLKLTFQRGNAGGLSVFVELQPDLGDPARMAFELCLDQSFIPGIIAELRADLAPFPQIGQP